MTESQVSDRKPTTRKGFTLLEVLVAATMTALLTGGLYAALAAAFKAYRNSNEEVGNFRRAELAADFICAELRSAAVPNGILAGTFKGADGAGADARDSDSVSFYRIADATDQDVCQGDIMQVGLACEPSSQGAGMDLFRTVKRNLLAQVQYDMPGEVLCRNVAALNFRYFDGVSWLDSWDSTTVENSLPLAIEVSLTVANDEQPSANSPTASPAEYNTIHVIWLPASTLTVGIQIEVAQ
jgi:prepilin-type N-terminal cleavage/methylation domain-containing protein